MSLGRGVLAAVAGAAMVMIAFLGFRLYGDAGETAQVSRPDGTGVVIGGPFALIDHTGQEVTEADFLGRPMLVFFGFTYCPDVCPMTMQAVAVALDQLGEDADIFQTVFISVDPERDTPESLAAYISSNGFPDNVVGLTGSPEAIRAAADAYRADYFVIEADEEISDYLIEHTSVVYLMDSEGRFVQPFTHASSPSEIAEGLRRFLRRRG